MTGRLPGLALLLAACLLPAGSAQAAAQWIAADTVQPERANYGVCTPSPCSYTSAAFPKIGMDSGGNSLAIFGRWNASTSHVELMTSQRPAGGSWTAPQVLADNVVGGSWRLAVNPTGNAVAVWSAPAGGGYAVFASVRTAPSSASLPSGLGASKQISAVSSEEQFPNVDVGSAGEAVAAWAQYQSPDNKVEVARKPVGGGDFPSTGTPVSSAGVVIGSLPAVALDDGGDAVVSWIRDQGGGTYKAEAAYGQPFSSFGPARTLGTATGTGGTAAAIDNNTEAIVVWGNGDTGRLEAAFKRRGSDFPATPEQVSAPGIFVYETPAVVLDRNGNATALFSRDQGSGQYGIEYAVRPAAGSFSGSGTLLSDNNAPPDGFVLTLGPSGNALAAWVRTTGLVLDSALRPAGGSFGPVVPIESHSSGTTYLTPSAALDENGNGVAMWTDFINGGATETVRAAGYDGAGPLTGPITAPPMSPVLAGQSIDVSVQPYDVWSPVASILWDFGDGASANTASASHAWASAGAYTTKLTLTDSLGNATVRSGQVTVQPAPKDTTAPVLSAVSMLRTVFAVAKQATPVSARRARKGTAFKFVLSETATLRIVIARAAPGRRSGKRCVKPTAKLRRKKACVRYLKAGTLTRKNRPAGAGKVPFSGRIGRRGLKPGEYRATLRATDAAGNTSAAKAVKFRIVAR